MSDILKLTTQLTGKNYITSSKPIIEPDTNFNINDITKVVKTNNDNSSQGKGNDLIGSDSNALLKLLNDPGVTITYLKNIMIIQEFINLLNINNEAFSNKVKELFDSILLKPSEITNEFLIQEKSSSVFKGEVFDFLRNFLNNDISKECLIDIAHFLKSTISKSNINKSINSLSNTLNYLKKQFEGNNNFTKIIDSILQTLSNYKNNDSKSEVINKLKSQINFFLEAYNESIISNKEIDKNISTLNYNLSRLNGNEAYKNFENAIKNLIKHFSKSEEKEFLQKLENFLLNESTNNQNSKVLKNISDIIKLNFEENASKSLSNDKLKDIITSLLSSPSNYTPLLHFILPLEHMETKAFCETWAEIKNEEKKLIHILTAMDVKEVGNFEIEIFCIDKQLNINLFCPSKYLKTFEVIKEQIKKISNKKGYTITNFELSEFKKTRSLMEVFKDLPKRRTGLNVKV